MPTRSAHVFKVIPYGDRWAVASGEEVFAVARRRADARALARSATNVLEAGRATRRVETVKGEPRSFRAED